jgi:hypothetical protein
MRRWPRRLRPHRSRPLGNDRREIAFFSFFPATTGLLDTDPRTSFPASKTVTFTKAGTYSFICTVHGPTMKGSIEVS